MKPIEKMSYAELKEAKERQKKLLSNSQFLKKLPDGGKKLIENQTKIDERLQKYELKTSELTDMLAGMHLSQSRINTEEMEWTGKIPDKNSFSVSSIPDSQILATDEDETDIVNILLTSNETDKIIIEEGKSPRPENHNEHLIRMSQHATTCEKKFKPYSTVVEPSSTRHQRTPPANTRSAVNNEKAKWENTAATPPQFKFDKGIVEINIEQSLQLQCDTDEKLREIEMKRPTNKIVKTSNPLEFASYSCDSKVNPEEEEAGVYDDEHLTDTCIVVCNHVMDDSE